MYVLNKYSGFLKTEYLVEYSEFLYNEKFF